MYLSAVLAVASGAGETCREVELNGLGDLDRLSNEARAEIRIDTSAAQTYLLYAACSGGAGRLSSGAL